MPHHAARLVAALTPVTGEPTDAELLARFVADRDAGAFELLVWRHAGLVLRTCRGVLGNRHSAEDAAQAVFLALARQAASVGRSGSVAGWLFRVARRIAVRAARRSTLPIAPTADLDAIPEGHSTSTSDPDLDRVLHEELARLPDVYRSPVLLCFFEGLSHADAAHRLGWPVGTVAGRIARAKDVLAARLTRRGVPLSLLTPLGFAVAPSFVTATTRGAVAFVTGGPQMAPKPVLHLAQKEIRMALAKKALGWGVVVVAVCSALAFGLRSSAEPPVVPPPAPQSVAVDKAPVPKVPKVVVGKGFAIAPVTTDLQRRLIRDAGPNSSVIVLMNGTGLLKTNNTLDVEAFNLGELSKGFKAFPAQQGKSVAHFLVHYPSGTWDSRDGIRIINFTLVGTAREHGFVPGEPTGSYHNASFEFDKYIRPLADENGAESEEPAVGDARVRVYPVRTPLSRALTTADAVVEVFMPLNRADKALPEDVVTSARNATEKLKLQKGQRVIVRYTRARNGGQGTPDHIVDACRQWAKDAGFELVYVQG
ncbi:ECF RNA polymerase sigma factor SigE [Gemmata sp. SH-PL17]|uniref:RNA polymerase sigma factor n=1 Tax=Gemmata sp. SH-PL17 TaxID=1630693 RepID=UPI00078D7491|nr:sigma-70 family RNA polymerase sigma factor [Gemmata sp. SH-PL17]AMV29409.1 ECF RNA polymerase sigma factor SigE [Gemmata sp. SH-PL17]